MLDLQCMWEKRKMFTLWRSLQYRTGVYLYRDAMYIFVFKTKSSKLLFIVEPSSNVFRIGSLHKTLWEG